MTHKKVCWTALFALALLPALSLSESAAATRQASPQPSAASAPRRGTADISASARQVQRLAEQLVTQKKLPGLAIAIVQNGKVVSTPAMA